MRLDDVAAWVTRRWVGLYTARLAPEIGDARSAEVESDLWEHRREAASAGLRPTQLGLEILARCLLGIPADLWWRRAIPSVTVAHERGADMNARIRSNWWVAPAIALAGLHIYAAVAGWRPPGWGRTDPFAVFILATGVATLVGVGVRNRTPKLAGVLVLSGVWVPLFAPIYSLVVQVFRPDFVGPVGPREYFGIIGVAVAVVAALGAVQNMTRRPIRPSRGTGRIGGSLSAPASS